MQSWVSLLTETAKEKQIELQMDKNVRTYWNLHKGQWSIQDRRTGLVVGRQPELFLLVGNFNVRKGGSQRVLLEG